MKANERLDMLVAHELISPRVRIVMVSALQECESWLEVDLNILETSMFVTHLAAALQRLVTGEELPLPPDALVTEVQASPDLWAFSGRLADLLSNKLEVPIPEGERAYIAAHLGALRLQAKDRRSSQS